MARLSFSANELNDLSKLSKEYCEKDLDNLYKCFREAHTRLFNEINAWLYTYNKVYPKLENSRNTLIVYNKAGELYCKGSITLDRVDLFEEYYKEYQSILSKMYFNNKLMTDIRTFAVFLNSKKKEVVEKQSSLYGLYSEAYKQLNEEEIYEG